MGLEPLCIHMEKKKTDKTLIPASHHIQKLMQDEL